MADGLREYVVNCRVLMDKKSAHRYFKGLFAFPDYYGNNLDALYDCLTELPPCRIVLRYPHTLPQLGDYAGKLRAVFDDLAAERDDIEVVERD